MSFFSQAPWGSQNWETSYSIPRQDPMFLQAISVPFAFPLETALLYGYQGTSSLASSRVRDNDSRFPNQWESNSGFTGQRGIAFLFRKRNFALNLDLSMQLAGNGLGQAIVEATIPKIRMAYTIPSKFIGLNDKEYKLEIFLELSELQQYGTATNAYWARPIQNALFKTAENANRPSFISKQIYANPGLSLNTSSNFMFEGVVKVPMNSREANRTLDELWTPEIQTHLGLKYMFPVK